MTQPFILALPWYPDHLPATRITNARVYSHAWKPGKAIGWYRARLDNQADNPEVFEGDYCRVPRVDTGSA